MEETEVKEKPGSDGGEDSYRAYDEEEDLVVQLHLEVGGVEGGGPGRRPTGEVEPRLVQVVEHQLGDRDPHDGGTGGDRGHHAHQERCVVAAADAVVQPFAVVVEPPHALVAHAAVFRPRPRGLYVAQVTPPVLDHVRVLRPVELRD